MQLDIKNISKNFGTKQVLDKVSFTATQGSALGLLGRNGAGKTTTIRIIMNVFPPDDGEILIDGRHLQSTDLKIGYLPEERGLYPKITIERQLIYLARLRGLPVKAARNSVHDWLERLSMTEYLNKKLETLSKGNQQKIQLALALLADPDIIILDEPFSGLDPVNALLLKDIINEQVANGKIVIFSSHQMGYVEEFCDSVALLNGGRIVLSGSLREIKRSYDRTRISVRVDGPDGATRALLDRLMGESNLPSIVKAVENDSDGCLVRLKYADARNALLKTLTAAGAGVDRFMVMEPSLEEIFIEKTGESV
jgi:ABC-2 type transport system ATP-binding protein